MNSLNFINLNEDIFFIEDGKIGVIYAPLLGKFFTVDSDGFNLIN